MSRRTQYRTVGLARIARIIDTDLYEPDPTSVWAFVTPAEDEERRHLVQALQAIGKRR